MTRRAKPPADYRDMLAVKGIASACGLKLRIQRYRAGGGKPNAKG